MRKDFFAFRVSCLLNVIIRHITRFTTIPCTSSHTLRSFLYHVNVGNGLPDVAVHMSFSTVPAFIVEPSSYPVTVSFEGGSASSNKFDHNRLITF